MFRQYESLRIVLYVRVDPGSRMLLGSEFNTTFALGGILGRLSVMSRPILIF